jgi:hypothetical protein
MNFYERFLNSIKNLCVVGVLYEIPTDNKRLSPYSAWGRLQPAVFYFGHHAGSCEGIARHLVISIAVK